MKQVHSTGTADKLRRSEYRSADLATPTAATTAYPTLVLVQTPLLVLVHRHFCPEILHRRPIPLIPLLLVLSAELLHAGCVKRFHLRFLFSVDFFFSAHTVPSC